MTQEQTYASAALGYRTWIINDQGQLQSVAREHTWLPGVNRSQCQKHDRPVHNCGCGMYAYHDLRPAVDQALALPRPQKADSGVSLVGAVACRGLVQSHFYGLRAEEACILALSLVGETSPAEHQQAHKIAEHYQVPLLDLDNLESFALSHALPVPRSQRGEYPYALVEEEASLPTTVIVLAVLMTATGLLAMSLLGQIPAFWALPSIFVAFVMTQHLILFAPALGMPQVIGIGILGFWVAGLRNLDILVLIAGGITGITLVLAMSSCLLWYTDHRRPN